MAMRVCATLQCLMSSVPAGSDVWVFGYGSLIWNPGVPVVEKRQARIYGYHRGLYLWSRVHRGTPEQPGLVLGLDRGGTCTGLAMRIANTDVPAALNELWQREMVNESYEPTWITARTTHGNVQALTFVVRRDCSGYCGVLSEQHVLEALHKGIGRRGTAREYLENTVHSLKQHGFSDQRLNRYVRLLHATS
jgi:glutathione-specific gamma-glutamylcyclotransferase